MDKNIGKTFICTKSYATDLGGSTHRIKKGSKLKIEGVYHDFKEWYKVYIPGIPIPEDSFIVMEKEYFPSKYYKPAIRKVRRIEGNR